MHRWLAGMLVVMLASSGLLGCSTSSPRKAPEKRAVERAVGATEHAQSAATRAAERAGPFGVRARRNPPDCDAPVFEIRAHGRWERAWLRGADTAQEQALDSLRGEDSDLARTTETIRLRGDYTGSRQAETGTEYPVFTVRSVIRNDER